jgi:hypothetical protein
MDFTPSLPYDGTEGFVPRETSEARARAEAESGRSETRQQRIMGLLRMRGSYGATWREASTHIEDRLHHSGFTSSLSTLHKTGRVAALAEQREHCNVYVLPEYVGERETVARSYVRAKPPRLTPEVAAATLTVEGWMAENKRGGMLVTAPDWTAVQTLIDHARGGTQ